MSDRPTNFTKLFQLRLPLVLAPLAGGPATPELVAAVGNAGGLGSLGAAYLKPQDIEKTAARLRELSSKPFAINLFVPCADPIFSEEDFLAAIKSTKVYRDQLHLSPPVLTPPFSENFDSQFAAVLKLRPAIFSFTFGVLASEYLKECRKAGIFTLGTATTLEEALQLQESGVDGIVLQGVEGGGHRGIFDSSAPDPNIPALELTKICARHLRLPLITAGGLMDGRDIAQALAAGAEAAQLGTAFLACSEAGTSAPYRQELLKTAPRKTRLTRVFSGRLARGIENKFMLEMEDHENTLLPFPAQNVFTRDLRKASATEGISDFLSLWAGTQIERIRSLSATELVEILKTEFENTKNI